MNRRATTFIRQLGVSGGTTTLGYGRLYNWYAASDANFAPSSWKVPTLTEYSTLVVYLGDSTDAGGPAKEAGLTHWKTPNTGATNTSGLTVLGAGQRYYDGSFANLTENGMLTTQTEVDATHNQIEVLLYNNNDFINTGAAFKKSGYSVRLLYTGAGTPTTMTDYDGNTYDVVHIGTQYWTKQNWKCTKLNDGTSIPEVTGNSAWAALTTKAWCYYNNDSGNL